MSLARIEASRVVDATPEAVFAFLSRLENHWKLTGRWVEAVVLNHDSGQVRIHGPLGLRRTATTTVVDAQRSHVMHGTAELSGGTSARVAWEMNEHADGTAVHLTAEVDRATPMDRLLLLLGGSRWMNSRFDAILRRLDEQLHSQ